MDSSPADELRTLGLLVVAMALAALIGLEREIMNKPAGMRTHMLVAAAVVLFVSLIDAVLHQLDRQAADDLIRADPIRVFQAIALGVSFLGAGTIIRREGGGLEGLTTAATLLFTAAVSIAVATERFLLAVGATLIALGTLRGGSALERRLRAPPPGAPRGEGDQPLPLSNSGPRRKTRRSLKSRTSDSS